MENVVRKIPIEFEELDKAFIKYKKNKFDKCNKILLKNVKTITTLIKFFIKSNIDFNKVFTIILEYIEKLILMLKALYENGYEIIVPDSEYDKMLDLFKEYEPEPIEAITLVGRREVNTKHNFPSLRGTLNKARYIHEKDIPKKDKAGKSLERFIDKCFDIKKNLHFVISLKYDGVSIILTIDKDGEVVSCITRGDENKGADLTHLFKGMKFKNHKKFIGKKMGLKTECIMTANDYKEFCIEKDYKFANLRTSVTSIITDGEGSKYSKYLSLVPLYGELKDGTEIDSLSLDNNYTTKVPYLHSEIKAKNKKDFLKQFVDILNYTISNRDKLGFAIDGLVIDCLDTEVRRKLGRKHSINEYQIAYKFPSIERRTIVRGVKYTVGRTGLITPMVYYDEIDFNGTKHNHSSLSSYDRFKELNLYYGDEIIVSYNNDVMPYVSKDHYSDYNIANKEISEKIDFTITCPSCGKFLCNDGANAFCKVYDCPSKNINKLVYFCKVLGIRDIDEKSIEKMFQNGVFNNFETLMNPRIDILKQMEGFKDKKINKFKKQIKKLKEEKLPDYILLTATGICGPETAKTILEKIDIETLIKRPITIEDYQFDNIEFLKKQTIIFNIGSLNMTGEISRLIKMFNLYHKEKSLMRVCFTGFRDKELKEYLESKNIDVVESLKDIRYLVVKDKGHESSKTEKARKKNIQIIDKDSFMNIINNL